MTAQGAPDNFPLEDKASTLKAIREAELLHDMSHVSTVLDVELKQSTIDQISRLQTQLIDVLNGAELEGRDRDAAPPNIDTVRAFTEEMATHPYGKAAHDLIVNDASKLAYYAELTSLYNMAHQETKDEADRITDGGIGRFSRFMKTVREDMSAILHGLTYGTITVEELGITQKDRQVLSAAYMFWDMDEVYDFMYRFKNRPTFSIIRSGEAVTGFIRVDKRSKQTTEEWRPDLYADPETITHLTESGFSLSFSGGISPKDWTPGTKIMFFLLNREVSASHYEYKGDNTFTAAIPLSEVMRLRDMTSPRVTERTIRKELKVLANHEQTFRHPKRGFLSIPLKGGRWGIFDGMVTFTFSAEAMRNLFPKDSAQLKLNDRCYSIDIQKFPHAFNIYYELFSYSYTNTNKRQENKLKVTNLLKKITSLPKPSEITDRTETNRIMKPLENNLDHLVDHGLLEKWEYEAAAGKELTPKQIEYIESDKPTPWNEAKNLYIVWAFKDEDQEERQKRVEYRDKRRLEAKRTTEEKTRKRKASEDRRQKAKDKKMGELEATAEFRDKEIDRLKAENEQLKKRLNHDE